MNMPHKPTVLGCHQAVISDERRAEALSYKSVAHLEDELSNCVLIELSLPAPPTSDQVNQIACGDQAAWLEETLSEDGTRIVDANEHTGDCRFAFYIHFYTGNEPIRLWDRIEIRPLERSPTPPRLARLIPYEAVD